MYNWLVPGSVGSASLPADSGPMTNCLHGTVLPPTALLWLKSGELSRRQTADEER
jgi:hypothetical protein